MAHMYDRVVTIISKPAEDRAEMEVDQILPWFRKKSDLFRNLRPEVVKDIIKNCRFDYLEKDTVVIRQGDKGDRFYIILNGGVSIYINPALSDADNDAVRTQAEERLALASESHLVEEPLEEKKKLDLSKFGNFIGKIDAGKSFGELALINKDCVRNASIITDVATDLLVVDRTLYNRSLHAYQAQEFAQRSQFTVQYPLFSNWQPRYKKQMAMSLRKDTIPYEGTIVKQGDPVENLYFLLSGQVKILVDPVQHQNQYPGFYPIDNIGRLEQEEARVSIRKEAAKEKPKCSGKVSRTPSDIRKANLEKKLQRQLELCVIGAVEIIGHLEKNQSPIMEALRLIIKSLKAELTLVKRQRDTYLKERDTYLKERDEARACLVRTLGGIFPPLPQPQDRMKATPPKDGEALSSPTADNTPILPSEAKDGVKLSSPLTVALDPCSEKTNIDVPNLDPTPGIPLTVEPGKGPAMKKVRSIALVQKENVAKENRLFLALKDLDASGQLNARSLIRYHMDTRKMKVLDQHWLDVQLPLNSKRLIISDSIFRAVDSAKLDANVFVFGGMCMSDLLGIMFKAAAQGVKTDVLVLCAGTNDIFAQQHAYALGDLKDIILMARGIASRIVVCTAHKAGWRPRKSRKSQVPEHHLDNLRRDFNVRLIQSAKQLGVQVLDLEAIFASRTGRIQNVPGWYMQDSIHPNVNGTIAIEICLLQLLSGEPVVPPSTEDPRLLHSAPQKVQEAEIRRQKDRQQQNRPHLSSGPAQAKKRTKQNTKCVRVTFHQPDSDTDNPDTWDNKRQKRQ